MNEVIRDGNRETVSRAMSNYLQANLLETMMKTGRTVEHLYVQFLHIALKYDEDRLELVAHICIEAVPSGLLLYYVAMYKDISWKVAHALTKLSDLDKEMNVLDMSPSSIGDLATERGRQRLLYLKKGDV